MESATKPIDDVVQHNSFTPTNYLWEGLAFLIPSK
jgi:hypothetical protein